MSDTVVNAGLGAPHDHDSGVDLLSRVARGDPRALAEFYDRYASRVHALTRRVCGEEYAAEDVTQEVFLTIWRTANRFDGARGSVAS